MLSKWYDKKADALQLRKNGVSLRTIEKSLGVPKSTLSGWFKEIKLSDTQKAKLSDNQQATLKDARSKAVAWHNSQRNYRLAQAEAKARESLAQIELSPQVIDLVLAALYIGRGRKTTGGPLMSSANPKLLRVVLTALRANYGLGGNQIYLGLHLRADQNADEEKLYWSQQLKVPAGTIRYVTHDKRTIGKPSLKDYHGVCDIYCGLAIQRKLIYLYNLFCEEAIAGVGV